MLDLDSIDFAKGGGLVSVVAQDATTGDVLMIAFADREALEAAQRTGEMHYHSRTRGLWHKGATSGNTQKVVSLSADCDGDAILARVIPAGPSCHTGAITCFTLPGVTPPAEAKPMLDFARYQRIDPGARKQLVGDGNFGGLYQRPDADMLALWDVAVAETRALIASGWD